MPARLQIQPGRRFDVVGLGTATLDALALVDHFPSGEASVHHQGVQQARELKLQGGGPIATAIATIARLGGRTAMIDTLGDDWIAERILAEFEALGVDSTAVDKLAGRSSPFSTILVRKSDGERHIIFSPGSTGDYPPQILPANLIRGAAILHLNGCHFDACVKALPIARNHQVLVSLDGGKGRYRDELRQLLPDIDIAILSLDFAIHLTRSPDLRAEPAALAQKIREKWNPPLVVITDGTLGSWIDSQDEPAFHQPAFRVGDTVDTTGCGDVYHGAFLYAFANQRRLAECAAVASAAAALNATALGGRGRLTSFEEALVHAQSSPTM